MGAGGSCWALVQVSDLGLFSVFGDPALGFGIAYFWQACYLERWQKFEFEQIFVTRIMPMRREQKLTSAPAWEPSPGLIRTTNIAWLMQRTGTECYEALQAWSVRHREEYWRLATERLGLSFQRRFDRLMDLSQGVEKPRWLLNA